MEWRGGCDAGGRAGRPPHILSFMNVAWVHHHVSDTLWTEELFASKAQKLVIPEKRQTSDH